MTSMLILVNAQYTEVFQKIKTVSGTLLGLLVWSNQSWCSSDFDLQMTLDHVQTRVATPFPPAVQHMAILMQLCDGE